MSPGPGLGWQQGTPSPPLPVVHEALPMVHKMKMDIQDISYFECFKCHQKCLQTNSIILKLFLEKEVLIYFDDIFNDKWTASAPLLTNTN